MTWETLYWKKKPVNAAETRDRVIDWLRRELVGPSPGYPMVQIPTREEVLRPQDPPRYRYSCGVLFPRGVTYSGSLAAAEDREGIENAEAVDEGDAGEPEELSDEPPSVHGEEDETEAEVDATSMFVPSTMGLSFLLVGEGGITVDVSWGTYRGETLTGWSPGEFEGERPRRPNPPHWFRQQHDRRLELGRDRLVGTRVARLRDNLTPADAPGQLMLDVVSRPWRGRGRLVTVTLMNATETAKPINERCFFQCGFRIVPAGAARIAPYPERPDGNQDEEEKSLALLFRHRPTFAVGHGCAADWDVEDGTVSELRTEVMPVFQQPPVVARDKLPGVELSLASLAKASLKEVMTACENLASRYEGWIVEREAELGAIPTELRATGKANLDACRACLARMRDGVSLLGTDGDVLRAFSIMNRAMLEQRAHYELSGKGRQWASKDREAVPETPFANPAYPASVVWRPFQLAFILMNLRSLAERDCAERDIVDIIWFPTGGGKTEAYLGLAAYGILLRRLRDRDDAGTTVLMRYTLRLLTTQQFQRAASLICALELVRRKDPKTFGPTPITIGLWLGGGVTDNQNQAAVRSLKNLQNRESENRFVVLSCPWCGIDMGLRDYGGGTRVFGYREEKNPPRVRFVCEDPGCAFSTEEGLPLEVVDEAIYEQPPTLLIGTVDKFAMMPWRPEARKIFGIDNEGVSPPSLIIQDELHLISGPLGSMVGHYETVIDELCSRAGPKRLRPKIVASTATIARAPQQVKAIYGRASSLFPPQGLVAGESFFAQEGRREDGRTYVGVLGSADSSHIFAQVKTIAALLQAPKLVEGSDEVVDSYWTLMCYFNSLRELGRAATLINADIREYLNAVWARIGLREDIVAGAKGLRRFVDRHEELTSRRSSGEIPEILQRLFAPLPKREVIDLCLATNMIQVGLDVPRLSLMTVVGQPKGASEYIQASSRVGRDLQKPGLVVTNYNPFKPRDRSHFETFRSFHENVYRYVEATSVTPFSLPVCERAIHALAVTLVRFLEPSMRERPESGLTPAIRDRVRLIILERVRLVDADEEERAMRILDTFLDDWERVRPNSYGSPVGMPDGEPMMWPAGRALPPSLAEATTIRMTAQSLRNVDAECEAKPLKNFTVKDTA